MQIRSLMGVIVGFAAMMAAACDSEPPPREVPLAQVEQEVVAIVCDRMFSCDCPENGRFYESKDQCENTTRALADQLRLASDGQGLTWDPSCLGAVLDTIDDAGCGASFDVDFDDECVAPCLYLHGNKSAGTPCEVYGNQVSDCDQGLTCINGTCAEPCGDGTGDPRGDVGDSCQNGCRDGLFCDFNVDRCEKLPTVGQGCDLGQCAEGSFCEAEDLADPMSPLVCKAPRGLSEPCRGHAQCESGFCPAGFCSDLPEKGESCRGTFVCAPGFDCVEEVCVEGAPAICGISVPLPGL